MSRDYNTDIKGKSFDSEIIDKVWEKGKKIVGVKTKSVKKDKFGEVIAKFHYGDTIQYGWEIDHIKPVSKGGTDDLSNLQPLYWENNRHKENNYPKWKFKKKI